MIDSAIIKTFLYVCLALISLAGTFFAIGKWTGRKNNDSQEIDKLKLAIEQYDTKSKARLYKPDGEQIFLRAEVFEKSQVAVRAVISEIQEKQHTHDLMLASIDTNVKTLMELFKQFIQINKLL